MSSAGGSLIQAVSDKSLIRLERRSTWADTLAVAGEAVLFASPVRATAPDSFEPSLRLERLFGETLVVDGDNFIS